MSDEQPRTDGRRITCTDPDLQPAYPFDTNKDTFTVYETSMLWKGKDPWPKIVGDRASQSWMLINGDRQIYFAIKEDIDDDKIASGLIVKTFLQNGDVDVLNCKLKRKYLIELAERRDERPKFLFPNEGKETAISKETIEAMANEDAVTTQEIARTPPPLTKQQILHAEWPVTLNLGSALEDVPKWLESAIVVRGKRGNTSSTWNVAQLGICLCNHGVASKAAITIHIQRHFPEWLDLWESASEHL